ncbi:MAG: hypothetical protein HY075_04760 [Deltaproteobacteria bacterium]|nr:hypothetical protein [Deltaproteobacteria bacterium]
MTLSQLINKQVALAEVKGSPESVKHVEVAIINEILDKGRMQIVDHATVQDALVAYPTEHDYGRLGKKVGADYVLAVKIKNFDINEREGYDKVTEEDSVLAEESGERGAKVLGTRYEKVKGWNGLVKLQCTFFDVAADKVTYEGFGEAADTWNTRDKDKHEKGYMGKMQLLEQLAGRAITDFFEKIPK